MPLLQWHIKSTTKAQQGLYEYDAVSRLRDSQLADRRQRRQQRVTNIHNYIVRGVLWQALHRRRAGGAADRRDRQGRHRVPERPAARDRPDGVLRLRDARARQGACTGRWSFITSNNEKELPDAFLRRCFFHYIKFPTPTTMKQIVAVHFPNLKKELLGAALKNFYDVRNLPGLKKKPGDLGAARLAEAAGGRRHSARSAAEQGRQGRGAAAGRRAAEERAGRLAVREARLHAAPQPLDAPSPSCCPSSPSRWQTIGCDSSRSGCSTSMASRAPPPTASSGRSASPASPSPTTRAATSSARCRRSPKATGSRSRCSTRRSGAVIGSSSYHDIVPAVERRRDRLHLVRAEPPAHARQRRPAKLLLMRHALRDARLPSSSAGAPTTSTSRASARSSALGAQEGRRAAPPRRAPRRHDPRHGDVQHDRRRVARGEGRAAGTARARRRG